MIRRAGDEPDRDRRAPVITYLGVEIIGVLIDRSELQSGRPLHADQRLLYLRYRRCCRCFVAGRRVHHLVKHMETARSSCWMSKERSIPRAT